MIPSTLILPLLVGFLNAVAIPDGAGELTSPISSLVEALEPPACGIKNAQCLEPPDYVSCCEEFFCAGTRCRDPRDFEFKNGVLTARDTSDISLKVVDSKDAETGVIGRIGKRDDQSEARCAAVGDSCAEKSCCGDLVSATCHSEKSVCFPSADSTNAEGGSQSIEALVDPPSPTELRPTITNVKRDCAPQGQDCRTSACCNPANICVPRINVCLPPTDPGPMLGERSDESFRGMEDVRSETRLVDLPSTDPKIPPGCKKKCLPRYHCLHGKCIPPRAMPMQKDLLASDTGGKSDFSTRDNFCLTSRSNPMQPLRNLSPKSNLQSRKVHISPKEQNRYRRDIKESTSGLLEEWCTM
ncbi:hypothetical protein BT63DRAFT_457118 [Microthyrium microscopicum]|uniref:WAP domain-containing protein n=1 Tax=Microthyrium microscopicum TaxID=703497 RepID=A0A6A6U9M4_9PEZI|nr:hypothetical protein BT63DRAFT_457118 [Microthyrium microscopicum]